MNRLLSNVIRFWNEDRSLTVMLLLLLLFIFIIVPFISPGNDGQILLKIIYSVILLTGILSVSKHKTFVIVISILAVIGLGANWLGEINPTRSILLANDFGAIIFNFFFAIAILIKTFQPVSLLKLLNFLGDSTQNMCLKPALRTYLFKAIQHS